MVSWEVGLVVGDSWVLARLEGAVAVTGGEVGTSSLDLSREWDNSSLGGGVWGPRLLFVGFGKALNPEGEPRSKKFPESDVLASWVGESMRN